jgi:hypothetical protein
MPGNNKATMIQKTMNHSAYSSAFSTFFPSRRSASEAKKVA